MYKEQKEGCARWEMPEQELTGYRQGINMGQRPMFFIIANYILQKQNHITRS